MALSSGETVTIQDAARRVGCDWRTMDAAIKQGRLPVLRLGKTRRIPRAALERFLAGEYTSVEGPGSSQAMSP